MIKARPRTAGFVKIALSAGLLLLAGLASGGTAQAGGMAQETFASPEQAGDALAAAWRSGEKKALRKLFGPAGMGLVSSGDAVADRNARTRLAAAYDAGHRIERDGGRKAQIILGEDEFPYPIPLVREGKAWRFDAVAGRKEILDRRIGRNELFTIESCHAYVEAQQDYASRDRGDGVREYATKIVSSDGKHDGLYWPARAGEEESPLGPLAARAAAEGYGAMPEAPYHGYYYRILTRQGPAAAGGAFDYMAGGRMTRGFALVAFPAKYGNSGVMTFIVSQDGIVFEKNLGPHTARIARRMTEYDPDPTWRLP